MWIFAAVLSALFAGATSILSKCGIKKTDSDVATALRTSVVLAFAWLIVLFTGEYKSLSAVSATSWLFLLLSGLATGASWICYFRALSLGDAAKVAAVDKSSVVLSVIFAMLLFADERNLWYFKLAFLALIALGTFFMSDVRRGGDDEKKKRSAWLIFALLSAVFAALTSVLAKLGISGVPSNAATAVRTSVVFAFAWLIVFARGKGGEMKRLEKGELIFLALSGIATGVSWLCYYYAIQAGRVSVVVPIDKLSIVVTVVFSRLVFGEKLSARARLGLGLIVVGSVSMAVFT